MANNSSPRRVKYDDAKKSIEELGPGMTHLSVDLLQQVLFPSVGITSKRTSVSSLAIGQSRFGGVPDLPESLAWPTWVQHERRRSNAGDWPVSDSEERHLSFIAQINFADIAQLSGTNPHCSIEGYNPPAAGFLYFFYDAENKPTGRHKRDRGGARVLFFDGPVDDLVRVATPTSSTAVEYSACSLTFCEDWTLPDPMSVNEEDYDYYRELHDEVCGTNHRMFGWHQLIQPAEMEVRCELMRRGHGADDIVTEEVQESADDWMLLLQAVEDIDGPGWRWGDGGRLYFWIRGEDLAARDFENIWLLAQSH